ncbi:hypothetical protein DNTS_026766, partial [Danionella cerebrum]
MSLRDNSNCVQTQQFSRVASMSKMPSKKKSCFQITSVITQAHAAANSPAEDTESLEDPDESSKAEDVSTSEKHEPGKPGDPETGDDPQHNEAKTPVAGNPDAPVAGSTSTGAVRADQTSPASFPTFQASTASVSSCSSRFRVIKLDHGIGEPFRRGRWTCTEFYERDPDPSTSGRTAETLKHAEHTLDKDRHAGGSVSITSGGEPHTDSGYVSAPSNPPAEPQQQTFSVSQQASGLVAQRQSSVGNTQYVRSPSFPSTVQPQQICTAKPAPMPGLTVVPVSQTEYTLPPPASPAISGASLSLVTPLNQGPSPVMTPAAGSSQVQASFSQPVDGRRVPISQLELTSAVTPQASAPLVQPGLPSSASSQSLAHGIKNVPAVLSSAFNVPQTVPKQATGVAAGAPSNSMQIPSTEESRRIADVLLQSSVVIGKDATMKRFSPEGLQLPAPAVRSLFGIAIPFDGDEDRNPSSAFYQAFPNGTSKAVSDGYDHCDLYVL